jgi:hypothetical protein
MTIRPQPPAPEDIVRQLVTAGRDVPKALVDQILTKGDAVVEPLGEVMLDGALWNDPSHGGWGPIHAMHLLWALKSLRALPFFEKLLVPDHNSDWITEDMPSILAAHGPGAMESLERIASNREATSYNRNAAVRALCPIATRHPECKPEVVGFLRGFFDGAAQEDHEFLCLICDDLAGLRDPDAMADLREAKEKGLFEESPFAWESMEETYAGKGVPPTISHDDTDPMRYFSADSHQEPVRRYDPQPGRNQPCPCGSGKKYKKCCGSS